MRISLPNLRKKIHPLIRFLSRLFCRRVHAPRCISSTGENSVIVPGAMLSSVETVEIRLAIQWPLLSLRGARPVTLRLVGIPPRQNGIEIECHCRSGLARPKRWLAQIAYAMSRRSLVRSRWRTTFVRGRFSSRLLAGLNRVRLEVRERRRSRTLAHFEFEVFDAIRAQWLRVNTLEAANRRLWIQSGNHWQLGDFVPHSADAVVLEFTIPRNRLGAALPPRQTRISFELFGDDWRADAGSKCVMLEHGALRIKSPPIILRAPPLCSTPGVYRVAASVAGRLLAEFSFRVVAKNEWLQHVEIPSLALETETNAGDITVELGALRWKKHVAFRPCVRIATPLPAPNTLVNCVAQLTHDGTLLRREEFVIRLDRPLREARLRRFDLQQFAAHQQKKHVRLLLTIALDGRQKFATPVVVLPADSMSNFEGQLRRCSDDFPVDDEAYREIVERLCEETASR